MKEPPCEKKTKEVFLETITTFSQASEVMVSCPWSSDVNLSSVVRSYANNSGCAINRKINVKSSWYSFHILYFFPEI